MSRAMANKYTSKIFNEIYCNSNEYKAYNLGLAVAYSHLYEYVKTRDGQCSAQKLVDNLTNTKELYAKTLKEIIELSEKEPETNAEKLAEKIYECKRNCNQLSAESVREETIKEFEDRMLKKIDGCEEVNGYWLTGFVSYLAKEMLNESR